MDIFSAVGFVVAVEQVSNAVRHAAPPRAINEIFHSTAVLNHDAQQITQRGRTPIARHVGFCKTDVTRFHAGRKDLPVF